MLIFKTVQALRDQLAHLTSAHRTVGFIPTMGALHEGHISLIQTAQANDEITVCSIFVNPTQFNDPHDLEKYPRTYREDVQLLVEAGTDILFYPDVNEIYPTDFKPVKVDLRGLDLILEGEHRPGHFDGVVQVVHRLLSIVQPDRLYMGQKDFQQFSIIREMIGSLNLPVQLVVCPILRETNGLAMSSRNKRLSPEGRAKAGLIYRVLLEGKKLIATHQPPEIEAYCLSRLPQPEFKPDYFSIVDSITLKRISRWDETEKPVACVAVWLEGVRLIDNEYYA